MDKKLKKIENELDEALKLLGVLRNAGWRTDVDSHVFFKRVEKQVQKVVKLFEPFYSKNENRGYLDPFFANDMNRVG